MPFLQPPSLLSPLPLLLQPPPASLVKNVPELGRFAVFDCECSSAGIYCFCLISPYGESVKLHVKRCKSELEFVTKILDTIEKYDIIAGHNITGSNSDIDQIQKMCKKVGSGLEDRFFEIASLKLRKTIDAWRIFSNNVMKGALAQRGIEYATNKLEIIASAYIGEGKLDGLTGASIETSTIETQLQYCYNDCELDLKILAKDDYRIFRLEHSISKVIKQDFIVTCRSSPSGWWESLLQSEGYRVPNVEKIKIGGGKVLDPVPGVHKNVVVKDCSSLYPTIASTRNLSSEIINCSCCEDLLPNDIMDMINQNLKEPRPPYRICKNKRQVR